jgi:hypothetical protein
MADDSKQSFPNIGGNGFVWILLVAAGTFFVAHQPPLEGSRPPTTGRLIPQQARVQDIDARLWQDPFGAVAEQMTKLPELRSETCPDDNNEHCQSPLSKYDPNSFPSRQLVLVVPVSGSPYSDDRESRRRTRYAVLAGLNAEGFAPEDEQHIKFYRPGPTHASSAPVAVQVDVPLMVTPQPPLTTAADVPVIRQPQASLAIHVQVPLTIRVQAPIAPLPKSKLPEVIPYEWFAPKSTPEASPYDRVLLLWIDEDSLRESREPLKRFAELLCPSAPTRWSKVAILGPYSSTTLRAMVDEVSKEAWNGICPGRPRPQFYVHSATADDATLLPNHIANLSCRNPDSCLSDFFEKKHVALHRMIATDEALALTIRKELLRRHLNVGGPNRPSPGVRVGYSLRPCAARLHGPLFRRRS